MFKRKCRELQALISSGIDGEVTEEQRVVLEQHLAECPDKPDCAICRDSKAILEAVKVKLGTLPELSDERNRELTSRIQEAIACQPKGRIIGRGDWRYRFAFMGAAAAALVLLVLALRLPFGGPDPVVADAVLLHEQHIETEVAEIRSEDPAEIEMYFAETVDFPVTVHDLSEKGWVLSGGSCCKICGETGAHVDYHKDGGQFSVFTLPAGSDEIPGTIDETRIEDEIIQHDDCFVLRWTGDFGNCILVAHDREEISDIGGFLISSVR